MSGWTEKTEKANTKTNKRMFKKFNTLEGDPKITRNYSVDEESFEVVNLMVMLHSNPPSVAENTPVASAASLNI